MKPTGKYSRQNKPKCKLLAKSHCSNSVPSSIYLTHTTFFPNVVTNHINTDKAYINIYTKGTQVLEQKQSHGGGNNPDCLLQHVFNVHYRSFIHFYNT